MNGGKRKPAAAKIFIKFFGLFFSYPGEDVFYFFYAHGA